ncbi:MAG: polyphosphate kinase 2 family protein [Candidatus Omnitrophica bacterium]|nr:polyphosphate kinase 2 family protein [Candidatus Omnitrophota bacterium]
MAKKNSFDCCRVKHHSRVSLKDWDPADHRGFEGDKKDAEQELLSINKELNEMQELLYAEHKHRILVVLQGIDASGKDGVVRHVFGGLNPQGVRVVSFKSPSTKEMDHDYLWRIHQETPAKGEIAVFNRSHYEDVLIVRVHEMVPKSVWEKRYDHIRDFERMLTDEGTIVLKFFLWIDQKEQQERLQARLNDPDKRWKFQVSDLEERKFWPDYVKAYEDMLSLTSTDDAPWYIVPSNKKWYRNMVVSRTLLTKLKELHMQYPDPKDLKNVKVPS